MQTMHRQVDPLSSTPPLTLEFKQNKNKTKIIILLNKHLAPLGGGSVIAGNYYYYFFCCNRLIVQIENGSELLVSVIGSCQVRVSG